LLGHASASTTQAYTQVSIRQLKQIHTAAELLTRLATEAEEEEEL
jgi:site-specific recombinase XerD